MSGANEARFLDQHESCQCKCRFSERVRNSKQKWNYDKLDDWGSFEKDHMSNPSTCDCDCNKTCKIDKCLYIKNCSCKKRLIGKLVLECEDKVLNTTEPLLNDKK